MEHRGKRMPARITTASPGIRTLPGASFLTLSPCALPPCAVGLRHSLRLAQGRMWLPWSMGSW